MGCNCGKKAATKFEVTYASGRKTTVSSEQEARAKVRMNPGATYVKVK